ncbi:Endonuclease, partial [Actinidia chinensis var. chinensis]
MILFFWNIRGFNLPLKQNGVLKYLKRNNIAVMGILETKLNHQSLDWLARNKFLGWRMESNFSHHPNGRILLVWKEDLVQLDIIQTTDQAIHCLATCKSSNVSFYISFIYAFNTPVGRRPLWHNLRRLSYTSQNPWILLGDFNNVLSPDERINGQPVTMYETREFKECCYDIGISDIRSAGVFHTWTNNKTWCKLDRAMINRSWIQRGFSAQANFDLPGILSDHSPCTISILGDNDRGACPFKFFNMWTRHENFLELVNNSWGENIRGSAMFKLCKKLKALKEPLKN